MERFFNTAGPCNPAWHYMLPAAPRLPEARPLIGKGMYFVVHAPRQTGKTTTLRNLAKELTAEGEFAAMWLTCESAAPQISHYDVEDIVLGAVRASALDHLPDELRPPEWPESLPGRKLRDGLAAWARVCPRRLVLFFDEIDALQNEGLVTILRQLRDGYAERPDGFPWSVALCGLRDVRDYKVASGGDATRLGTASPFNIKVRSLRLGDFTEDDVAALYAQHTADTGQEFTPEALDVAWESTAGQPWLVNALAATIFDDMEVPVEEPVTAEHVRTARKRIIAERATHLDSLMDKLNEPRVERVIEPMISGNSLDADEHTFDDDLAYARDLGLVAKDDPIRFANGIYREVVARVLGDRVAVQIRDDPRDFVLPDGRLDFDLLLERFCTFWKRYGEVMTRRDAYHEGAAQLVILAWLSRLVNGGGHVTCEEAVGRGRIDVYVRWPYTDRDGKRRAQEHALELKVWREGRPDPVDEGLGQLDRYLDKLTLKTGVLVIFDRRADAAPITERTHSEAAISPAGHDITLLRA